jgi:hypothetical protein
MRENAFTAEFSCFERAGLLAPPLDDQINFWALAPEGMHFQQITFPRRLNVVSQQVVNIDADSGDGWRLVQTSMGAVPVVLVCPRF